MNPRIPSYFAFFTVTAFSIFLSPMIISVKGYAAESVSIPSNASDPIPLQMKVKQGDVFKYNVRQTFKNPGLNLGESPKNSEMILKVEVLDSSSGKYTYKAIYRSPTLAKKPALDSPLNDASLTWTGDASGKIFSHQWEGPPAVKSLPPFRTAPIFPSEKLRRGDSWTLQNDYPGIEGKQVCQLVDLEAVGKKTALHLKCSFFKKDGNEIKEESWLDPETGMPIRATSTQWMEIQKEKWTVSETVEQIP